MTPGVIKSSGSVLVFALTSRRKSDPRCRKASNGLVNGVMLRLLWVRIALEGGMVSGRQERQGSDVRASFSDSVSA